MITDPCSSSCDEVDSDIDEFDVVEEEVTIGRKNPFLPLHDSVELTLYDSYLFAFQFSLKHSLTKVAFTELLQLISVHLPKTASYPASIHSIKRFFLECFPHANPEVHHYCTYCLAVLPSDDMCTRVNCPGGDVAQFISVPLGPQLKNMMQGIPFCITNHSYKYSTFK